MFHPLKAIVNKMTGKEEVLRKNLSVIYTGDRLESAVREYRISLLKKYFAAGMVTAILMIAAAVSSCLSDRTITSVTRPDAGSSGRTVPVTVQGSYKGHTVESTENLIISAVVLSEKQKQKRLTAFAKKLPDRIVPLNQDGVRAVTDDLELPEKDDKTGIEMRWESSDPEILSE